MPSAWHFPSDGLSVVRFRPGRCRCLSSRRSTTGLSVCLGSCPRGRRPALRRPEAPCPVEGAKEGAKVGSEGAASAAGCRCGRERRLGTRLPAVPPECRSPRGAYLFIYLWPATLSASSLTGTAFLPGGEPQATAFPGLQAVFTEECWWRPASWVNQCCVKLLNY